jgi:DNA mismatch repair protein MutL
MLEEKSPRRCVKILRDSVARRIAAGEVIDRPASVVRELLDNAIDAGSAEIAVYIEDGGIGRIRVVDNGFGMTEEDLDLCCLPHATSKIETEDDLYHITSMGFRGEALSSIVTVSRTEITSRTESDGLAHKIVIHGGECLSRVSGTGKKGTIVDVADLFYAIPARRRFMKKPSAETAQCKATFLEKAVAFPEISFKFFSDGELKVFLPAADLLSRISAAYAEMDQRFLCLQRGEDEEFHIRMVASTLDLSRRDRKYIQVFVNRRRIWEYALIQGVEYAYGHFLPGGRFPSCFVFVEISPSLVDFNIHPAKKEAKIKNIASIRQRITEILDSYLRQLTLRNRASASQTAGAPPYGAGTGVSSLPFPEEEIRPSYPAYPFHAAYQPAWGMNTEPPPRQYPYGGARNQSQAGYQDLQLGESPAPGFADADGNAGEKNAYLAPDESGTEEEKKYDFIYRGQIFGLFLIAERREILYLVDQHATHERILYEALAADTLAQPLLIPCEFETDDEEDSIVEHNEKEVISLGIEVTRLGPRRWALTALPESFRGSEGDIIQALSSRHDAAGSLKKDLFAGIACKKAIKDGSPVDPLSACEIIQAVLDMEVPRCPHGRPLWFEISREELFRKVGRIV